MFFNDLSDIQRLAKSSHATIFAVDPTTTINLPQAINISPRQDKQGITIEQIREIINLSHSKQTAEQFIIIRSAETMGQSAANAFLKLLEEPSNNYHYILLTTEPHALLPTILSRASLFFPRVQNSLSQKPAASAEVIATAKRLLAATPTDLPHLADELAKPKDSRKETLEIVATAIELAYKSYFATKNPNFLKKIPKLINLHQNLAGGGLLKLHIVADLC